MSYATNLEHNKLYVNVLLDILPPRVNPFFQLMLMANKSDTHMTTKYMFPTKEIKLSL